MATPDHPGPPATPDPWPPPATPGPPATHSHTRPPALIKKNISFPKKDIDYVIMIIYIPFNINRNKEQHQTQGGGEMNASIRRILFGMAIGATMLGTIIIGVL